MSWNDFFAIEMNKPYFKDLLIKVKKEYENYECYPKYENIFKAFELTNLEDLKVVILGQDPYHEPNQAHGLAFSVLCEKLPPSLKNIYKEISTDFDIEMNQDGNLDYLAKQGVLLLNNTLTVRKGLANSHKKFGWEIFTDNVIKYLNNLDKKIVFILWGDFAFKKSKFITNPNFYIIHSTHPSPLSAYRGFFGSKPFSKCNNFLKANGLKEINWTK